jgi:hypothetical protein
MLLGGRSLLELVLELGTRRARELIEQIRNAAHAPE